MRQLILSALQAEYRPQPPFSACFQLLHFSRLFPTYRKYCDHFGVNSRGSFVI